MHLCTCMKGSLQTGMCAALEDLPFAAWTAIVGETERELPPLHPDALEITRRGLVNPFHVRPRSARSEPDVRLQLSP